jgi:hypothetical protein
MVKRFPIVAARWASRDKDTPAVSFTDRVLLQKFLQYMCRGKTHPRMAGIDATLDEIDQKEDTGHSRAAMK